jgi:sigma-B regulation protein RsbU (phosphoserine phosphatase)
VTFFYAQFDEASRQLTYVNAGHNPPLLLRARNALPTDAHPAHAHQTNSHQLNALGASRHPPNALPDSAITATNGLRTVSETRAEMVISDDSRTADTGWTMLTAGGMALGLFDKSRYEQETIETKSGDLLVAYTDGVTEALNIEGEEFGEARLQEVLAASSHLSADEVRERIVHRVRAWCQGAPQHDDLTFVILKVK